MFRKNRRREATADSSSRSRLTEVASEFDVRGMRYASLHENRAYGPQNFLRPVQNDFCHKIG
jgi:hypothetical protein